jgi:hypothetical protein
MLLIIGFNHRLISKKFTDFEEVSHYIECLMNYSRYNLKRSSKSEKSKSITYVCSCNSRKKFPFEKKDSCKEIGESMSDSLKMKTSGGSYESGEKKSKRSNYQACQFRIRFKMNSNSEITFVTESNLLHNHAPSEKKTSKVSRLA